MSACTSPSCNVSLSLETNTHPSVVYDVADQTSFQNIRQWLQEIERYAGDNVGRIIVGNKCDQVQRNVTTAQAKEFADGLSLPHVETSAKENTRVEEAFITLSKEIQRTLGKEVPAPAPPKGNADISSPPPKGENTKGPGLI